MRSCLIVLALASAASAVAATTPSKAVATLHPTQGSGVEGVEPEV